MKPKIEDLKKEVNKIICFSTNSKTFFATLKLVSVECNYILVDPKIPNDKNSLESYDYNSLIKFEILHKEKTTKKQS